MTCAAGIILFLVAMKEFCGYNAVGNATRNCEELPKEGFEFLVGKYKMFN